MIIPPFLNPGDLICIVSPASSINPYLIDKAAEKLENLGFRVRIAPHAKGKYFTYSGTPEERRADFMDAIADKEVKAILCSRGGYGIVQIIDTNIDYEFLRQNPKWIIGFSDVTVLHALMLSSGINSLHASMCKHLADFPTDDIATEKLIEILTGKMPNYEFDVHPLNRPGQASGRLIGGNMAVGCGLIGTNIDPFNKGDILFVEDIAEAVYKIDRMFNLLRLAGILPKLKGLVVGRFTEFRSPDPNFDTMETMIRRNIEPYNFPVAFDIPIGHVDENLPMIEGTEVNFTVGADKVSLDFSPNF